MYLAAMPAMAEDMSASIETVQLTLALFFFGLASGQLLYGPLSDRYGRRTPLFWGLALYVLATAAMVFVRDMGSFLGLRFLQAVGGCSGMIIGRAVVRDSYDLAGATRMFTILMAIQTVGPVAAPVLGAYLTRVFGWGSNFVFMTALGIAAFAAVRLALPETLPPERRVRQGAADSLKAFWTVLKRPGFRRPALAGSCGGAAIFSFISGSSALFMDGYGFTEAQYGWTFAAFSVILGAASQLNLPLLRLFPPETILRTALAWMLTASLSAAACCQLTGLPVSPVAALLIIVVCLLPVPLTVANSVALAMDECGGLAGSASSVLGVMQFAAAGAVSALLSLVTGHVAFPIVFMILVASSAAVAFLFLGDRRPHPDGGPDPAPDGAR
jgi:DHA1 family bicyclomycin/chloramphenicol resistance-like MFS transporter